ncbi:MAG: YbaN family protein [Planctomycetota bacterium]
MDLKVAHPLMFPGPNALTQISANDFHADATPTRRQRVSRNAGKRTAYLVAGLLCAAIAAGGAFVPLVPTTFPLIVASFCLVRSSPRLEKKLLRNRFFGPYLKYLDGDTPMPLKAKIISCVLMWTGVVIGGAIIAVAGGPAWLLVLQGVLAVIATVVIARWGRRASVVPTPA